MKQDKIKDIARQEAQKALRPRTRDPDRKSKPVRLSVECVNQIEQLRDIMQATCATMIETGMLKQFSIDDVVVLAVTESLMRRK
jgi:hypothetical protein